MGLKPGAGVLAVVLAAAVGCGNGTASPDRAHANAGAASTVAAAPKEASPRRSSRAQRMFVTHCGGCHTLIEAGARGTRAGDEAPLEYSSPNISTLLNYMQHQIGRMPSFRGRLSRREMVALARYVASVDGCGTRSPTACTAP